MTVLVTNDELAKDVVGAEALLERHRVRYSPRAKAIHSKEPSDSSKPYMFSNKYLRILSHKASVPVLCKNWFEELAKLKMMLQEASLQTQSTAIMQQLCLVTEVVRKH